MGTTISASSKRKAQLKVIIEHNKQEQSLFVVVLLACGILCSLMYAAMNIFVPMDYPGYSSFSQAVSELSAIGTPTRRLWIVLGIFYLLFEAAFGWGVLLSAEGNKALRITGWLIITSAVVAAFWPPMHQREVLAAGGKNINDTLHIVFTAVIGLLMMVYIAFAATAFKKRFRVYSVITILVMLAFGFIAGSYASKLESNLATPWMGVWERVSIFAGTVWMTVFAITTLYRDKNAIHSYVTLG